MIATPLRAITLALLVILLRPVSAATASPIKSELVLRDFTRIEVDTPTGIVTVSAGKGLERTYQWGGCSLSANMGARRSRWYGSLGAYDPAGRLGPIDALRDALRACKGISRTVVQEGQIHFADQKSAEEWIQRYSKISPTVWTDNGILAQWRIVPARDQFNFDLWLVCIRGNRPTKLAGADNVAVKLLAQDGSGSGIHDCAMVGEDVITDTQKVWRKHWQQVDEWKARTSGQP